MSTPSSVVLARRVTLRLPGVAWDALTAWGLAFALVLYLALHGGGWDVVVRDQIGVLVWWVVLLVAVAGLLPRLTAAGWMALALLVGWAAWTAIGIPTSTSAERTLAEVGRLSTYAGVLALALVVQGRAGTRHVVNGVASAIGCVTVLSVLSRLHPQAFPVNDQAQFLPSGVRRLSYPLNYWNAQATFMAMGAVLLLGVAATARTRLGQALAAATLPLTALGVYLGVSRGAAAVLAAGLVVYLCLSSDRLPKLATLLVAGGGGAILVSAATQRDALQTGVDTAGGRSEGAELIWLCLVVCAGVGLVQVAIGLLARHARRPRVLIVSPRATGIGFAVAAVALVVIFFASDLHHQVAHSWRDFKATSVYPGEGDVFGRFSNANGEGRYQFWQAAVDAFNAHPTTGLGAGTFEFWWAAHATIDGSIVDAHSLYLQTLAELGWVGAALLAGLVALTVGGGGVRTLRADGSARTLLAAATAGVVVFWLEATIDWVWQIPVMPVALMFLVAVIVGHRAPQRRAERLPARALVGVAAIVAFVPIALGLSTVLQVRASQTAAGQHRLGDALSAARTADRIRGTSTTAVLQEALVLEEAGALRPARAAAVRATQQEPTNWRTWLVRSRIETRLGQTHTALVHFRTARRLNPRSPLFQ